MTHFFLLLLNDPFILSVIWTSAVDSGNILQNMSIAVPVVGSLMNLCFCGGLAIWIMVNCAVANGKYFVLCELAFLDSFDLSL